MKTPDRQWKGSAMRFVAQKIRNLAKSQKGMTLVELIMAMAIMSILMAAYYSLFFTGNRHYEYVHDSYRKQNEARIAMSYVTTRIRQNDVLLDDPEMHAVSIGTAGSTQCLKIESKDADGNQQYEHIYGYTGPGGDTRLMSIVTGEEDIGSDELADGTVIADNLSGIGFSSTVQNGSTCITIEIKYDSTEKGRFEETMVLRAK